MKSVRFCEEPKEVAMKPINITKYPLVEKTYNLVREIDGLPASQEATFLVIKAGELMTELWKYFETHQPTAKLSDLMKEKLEQTYLGKKIRNPYFPDVVFTVECVSVELDGPDPQMNVKLSSKVCEVETAKWKAWQLKNNPLGGNTMPKELEQPYTNASKQSFYMSQVNNALPEIVS